MNSLVHLFVVVLVVAIMFSLVIWAIDRCKIPQPFNQILIIIAVVAALLFLLNLLRGFL